MAERDYALEMWRLLDPESNLINPKQLLDRIVCVKSGKFSILHNKLCSHTVQLHLIDEFSTFSMKSRNNILQIDLLRNDITWRHIQKRPSCLTCA